MNNLLPFRGGINLMSSIPELPQSLYSVRDLAISHVLHGAPAINLQPLYVYLDHGPAVIRNKEFDLTDEINSIIERVKSEFQEWTSNQE